MSHLTLSAVGGELVDNICLSTDTAMPPKADEVVVRVEAAPINNADLLFAAGLLGVDPGIPAALGGEGVGVVEQTGGNVDPALVGVRVLILPTFRYGTWAAATAVPVANVISLPASGDTLQQSLLGIPATAYALLHDFVPLRPGDWIGIDLANGAVGRCVIGLAKRAGINTLAVVRRHQAAEEVRGVGANLVVLDGEDLGARARKALGGATLRVLFEGTGDPGHIAELVQAVEDGGSVIAFASATGQTPTVPLSDLFNRDISLRAFFILNWLRNTPRARLEGIYTELANLIGLGAIDTVVEATYPLERYRDALQHAQQTGRSGKILFTPNP
jgi:NADPH:quinone reductase-like Zn-dependent oxidoreductase